MTGVISVTSPLDYETRRSYTLIVSTDDGRSQVNQIPEAQTTVNVNVLVCIYVLVEYWANKQSRQICFIKDISVDSSSVCYIPTSCEL